MSRLEIEPLGLHWLYKDGPTDLCAHGGVRVSLGGSTIFERGAEGASLTLSTAALHLLRTIERDYEPGSATSGQLIPCCGNWMVFDPDLNEMCNSPCPNGIEWTVRHVGNRVDVRLENGAAFSVGSVEWQRAVHEFSARVRSFFFADPQRVVADHELDGAWYPHFTMEWAQRHAASAEP